MTRRRRRKIDMFLPIEQVPEEAPPEPEPIGSVAAVVVPSPQPLKAAQFWAKFLDASVENEGVARAHVSSAGVRLTFEHGELTPVVLEIAVDDPVAGALSAEILGASRDGDLMIDTQGHRFRLIQRPH